MRKDPTEFRKRFAAWKNGKQPYKDGKPVVLNNYTNAKFNDDGTFTDDTTRVFDDFYVTPSGVKTKYGSYTDENWDRYKQQEAFFRTHDQQTGNLKYEPGLEIVSPEYDILTLGAGARTNAATQTFQKNRKIANAIAKGIKNNPALKVYNSNPSYLDAGGNVLQYQDYINSLFPNSKIKDIVYHSTWAKPFEQFDPSRIKRGYGFYFSPSENHLPFDRMVYSRVNIQNPLEIFPNKNRNLDVSGLWRKDLTEQAIRNGQHDGVVGVSNMRNPGEPEIVALNPDQIHILGSNKDLAGFKQFVNYPNSYKKSLNDANNIFDIAKEPYIKTSADIAKESSTIRELNRVNEILREFSDGDSRISNAYNNIKTFLQSPAYKKRLEKYYRDKGSSIITQNVAPGDRIGEQLYNMETSKLKIMPKGKLIDEVGNVKDSFGLYDPNSHSIQVASDAIFRQTPEHEMWHAARKAMPYLDNAKYKMRVRSLSDPIYYGDMAEQEVRVLDTLREMQEAGLDINNLTDDQIWNFLKDSPIDTHGTNVQSLIDNYWYDDIKNALRNFKTVIYPLGFGGAGYGSYNKYAE